MDEEERRAYTNACMHFFKFNADMLAPIFDDLTPRARGEALNAVYGLALYGEEPGRISKAALSAYRAARPNVLKARANASLKAEPTRADTRPNAGARAAAGRQLAADSAAATRAVLREHEASTYRSTQRVQAEHSTSTGGSTRASTQSGNGQPTGETPAIPPDVPPDVPPDTLSTMGLSTMGLVDDALGAPAYETGGRLFHAPCPVCGKRAVARLDANGAAYTTDACGEHGIELPPGYEARRGAEGYTLERSTPLTDGPATAEGNRHGKG